MLAVARYGTRDLERATAFYDPLAEILGARRLFERADAVGYQGAHGGFFVIGVPLAGEPTVGNGTQVGFMADSRAAVNAAHAKALELGGTCEGPPGIRGDDPDGFYAAYFRDLDGNKLLVFRHGPAD
jgi:catechol 2,3-dioxygenase-like lactoylglutathione lyase family enzyme